MAPAPAPLPLHLLPTRRATYNKSRKGTLRPLNWPHPLKSTTPASTIHPDQLAQAGFYSTPTSDNPTRSTCYLCQLVVQEWVEGDLPLELHLERNDQCGWAVLQHLQGEWKDGIRDKQEWIKAWGQRGEWWPKSDYINSARQASFAKGWPHEGVEGVPTKEEIAAAGWFFTPGAGNDSDDNCVCPFCTRTVEGWEQGDDPIALHKRKLGLKCPFFLAPRPDVVVVAQEEEQDVVAEPELEEEPLKPKMSRSKGRVKLTQRDDDDEVEEEEQEASQPAPPTRASRRTKATVPSSDGPETSIVGSAVKPSRPTRGGRKAQAESAPPSVVEEDEDEPASQSTSRATRARSEVVAVEVPAKAPAKGKAASARGRGKKAVAAVEEEEPKDEAEEEEDVEMEQPQEEIAPAPSKKKGTRSTSLASAASTKSRSRSTKSRSAAKGGFVVAEDEPVEPDTSLMDAAKVAEDFLGLDEGQTMDVVQEEEEEEPVVKPKAAVKGKKAAASKGKKAASAASVAPVAVVVEQPEERGPLTPTVASPSPRPIRSLPSKVNSPAGSRSVSGGSARPALSTSNSATTPAAADAPAVPYPLPLTSLYAPLPNPFHSSTLLPPPTAAELALTLGEWYDVCGRTVYEQMEREMERERKGLEERVELGRRELRAMLEAARRREGERRSPGKMRG